MDQRTPLAAGLDTRAKLLRAAPPVRALSRLLLAISRLRLRLFRRVPLEPA